MANLKRLPKYESDEDAEQFVERSDLSEYDLSGFRKLSEVVKERRAGRPPLGEKAKAHVSLRLDRDVIDDFKSTGKGWQSLINEVLRESRPSGTKRYFAVAAAKAGPARAFANAPAKAAKAAAAKAGPAKAAASGSKAVVGKKAGGGAMERSSKTGEFRSRRAKPASKKRMG